MGKEQSPSTSEAIYAAPVANATQIRAAFSRSLASSSTNPIAAGNQAMIARKKRAILYKNGYTIPGKAAALLAAEARSSIRHSSKLGGNIRKASTGTKRPSETDAHHVVAAQASGAAVARVLIFAVGIGINDRDNGVILPRYMTTKIATMPNASPHQHIHTALYYSNVTDELLDADDRLDQQEMRGILRSIANRLVQGQFVY
jgi:hypothetical protein